jgi:DNA-binding NarL/FixJ family response regulator
MRKIRILLADDHLLLAECIAESLQRKNFEIVGIAQDGRAMLEMAHQYKPDVIVADMSMPQLNGIEAARIIKKELPSTKVLFLTMHSELRLIEEAFRAGISGFITKDSGEAELIAAIQVISNGKRYITRPLTEKVLSVLTTPDRNNRSTEAELTPRQREILRLLAEGKTMKEAAAILNISARTAESHKYEIMRRLGVNTTAELVRYAVHYKLV